MSRIGRLGPQFSPCLGHSGSLEQVRATTTQSGIHLGSKIQAQSSYTCEVRGVLLLQQPPAQAAAIAAITWVPPHSQTMMAEDRMRAQAGYEWSPENTLNYPDIGLTPRLISSPMLKLSDNVVFFVLSWKHGHKITVFWLNSNSKK